MDRCIVNTNWNIYYWKGTVSIQCLAHRRVVYRSHWERISSRLWLTQLLWQIWDISNSKPIQVHGSYDYGMAEVRKSMTLQGKTNQITVNILETQLKKLKFFRNFQCRRSKYDSQCRRNACHYQFI